MNDQDAIGWGLHFKEGWHWTSIYVVIVLLATVGLVSGIAWSVVKHDIQGGLAITATCITLGSLYSGYLAVRGR